MCALFFSGVAAAQDKPVVAIYQMDDLANSGQSEQLSAMIETAIAATGKFRVMERSRLDKLLSEQGKARTGLVTTNTPGRAGGFEGVDYLVYGSITGLSSQTKSNLGSSLLGGMLGGRNAQACHNAIVKLGADIRITDARTGEVRYVTSIDQEQQGATACGTGSQIDATGLLRTAADNVATGLVTAIYPIQIAAVQPDGVMVLNYGSSSVTEGGYYKVFEKGEEIRDPATGEVIASNEYELGMIQITDAMPRISKAVPISGFAQPAVPGAIVRPVSDSEAKAMLKAEKKRRRR